MTSGPGSEVGHASTCTGMEEERRGVGLRECRRRRSARPCPGSVDARWRTVPHAYESTVDSVSGAEGH